MKDLTKGKESKVIFNFAIPMLLVNVFQQLYNVVDSIIVGNFIGKEALQPLGHPFLSSSHSSHWLLASVLGQQLSLHSILGQKISRRLSE